MAIALALLVSTGARLASNIHRVSAHETASGRVADIKHSVDSDADPVVTPYYQYDVDGQGYLLQGPTMASRGWIPPVGTTRPILFNPDDHADAVVRDLGALVAVPAIQTGFVALLAITSLLAMRHDVSQRLPTHEYRNGSAGQTG
jgi:hypothetical protein